MGLFERISPQRDYVWASRAAAAIASSRRKTNAATPIDKEDFEMSLPGAWQEQPAENGCEFVNRATGELLIVSVLRNHELAGVAELRPSIERLDADRRKKIETVSESQAILSDTHFRGTDRDIDARFDGHDPQNGIRFSVAIRGCANKILTLSLYRDSLAELAMPFTVYASLIFNLLKVKNG
jgi:hypothetical protein